MIMKAIKRLGMMAMLVLAATPATFAQDNVEGTISADVVNQYIWRGQNLGNAAVQPTLSLGYQGLSLTAWGNVGITNSADTKEFDFTLAYTKSGFNIGITDYWFSTMGNANEDPDGRYFMYKAHNTNHVFEGNIGYNFGPAYIQWYTDFAGNDYKLKDGKDKHAYSSYVELGAPFTLGGLAWNAAVGMSPFESIEYGNKNFAVVNASLKATKDIKISDTFSVPVFAQIATNPCSQKAYFVVGFTLHP